MSAPAAAAPVAMVTDRKMELEMEAGRKAVERRTAQLAVPVAPKKTDGAVNVIQLSLNTTPSAGNEPVDTGITETFAALANAPGIVPVAKVPAPNTLSGNTDASIEFLQDRTATHPLWHPQLSFKRVNPESGEEAKNFETASFARDANGNPDWDKVRQWIDNRQGCGNVYWTINAAKVMDKKPTKKDIVAIVSLHTDLDQRKGEDQDAAEERLIKDIKGYRHRASIIIKSGGGAWGIYDLMEPIQIDGDPDKIKDAESYNIALAHDLGGDNCHNIDRVARLPGTINVPNAKKRAKGRRAKAASVHSRSQVRHAIESFTKAAVDAVTEANRAPLVGHKMTATADEAPKGEKFKLSDTYEPIDPNDPLLAKLSAQWLGMLSADNYAAQHGGDRSRAEIAFAAVAMRAGIDDGTIARCLMDTRRPFGSNTRASNRLLIRVIEKAHQYADNPVLEQMNRDFAAGFIGGKFRVAKFDLHQRYPLQRNVEFLSKTDFTNGVINPKAKVPKFGTDGKEDGTKMARRGTYWLDLPGRSEFDAVTFKPGAPPIIEVERAGRVHRTINTYSGFSVVPDHVDSATKCAKYMAHVRDNVAGGNEELLNYIVDWMASGVQHPDDPGRSAISMRGVPGCGKGVFALGYGRLFGQHFLHATHKQHVTGNFNAHQAETCLIFVDEALYAEIAADAQILKTMTSETTKLLERKGIDSIQIDNFARPIFATNAEHPIQIEHNDRRYPAIYVQENKSFANEPDEQRKAEKRNAYFEPILDELKNGGSEALLGFLLDRNIRGFNAEAIPETTERRQQKLNSASAGDKIMIEFAQDGCLPGDVPNRPWIARAHAESRYHTLGLFDVMKAHGGTKLAHMSDTALSDIVKEWGFKRKPMNNGKAWEAPPLPDLRKAILAKFPAVKFDARTEWVAGDAPDDVGQGTPDGALAPKSKCDTVIAPIPEIPQRARDQAAAALALVRSKT
jgi:hypothetical protein